MVMSHLFLDDVDSTRAVVVIPVVEDPAITSIYWLSNGETTWGTVVPHGSEKHRREIENIRRDYVQQW